MSLISGIVVLVDKLSAVVSNELSEDKSCGNCVHSSGCQQSEERPW